MQADLFCYFGFFIEKYLFLYLLDCANIGNIIALYTELVWESKLVGELSHPLLTDYLLILDVKLTRENF
jgi:hypothetical protein